MDIPLYCLKETTNPDLQRYINFDGDWDFYFQKSTGRYLPAVSRILKYGFAKDERFHNYLLSVTKEEAKKILEESGEQGSRVHLALEMLVKGATLSLDTLLPNTLTGRPEKITFREWQCILAFKSFAEKYNPQLLAVEKTVAGATYAGTIDLICSLDITEKVETEVEINGKLKKVKEYVVTRKKFLLDFKTSSDIYHEYKAQTAAYFYADHGIKDLDGTGILRVGTKHENGSIPHAGYELKLWNRKQTGLHYQAFESARTQHNLKAPEFEKNEITIPTEITYKMPLYSEAPIQGKATNTSDEAEEIDVK